MKTHFFLMLISIILVSSCSKSNDTPKVPEVDENFIGLKSYGEKTGAYDECLDIFKSPNGYISFETRNRFDINIRESYQGNSDILIRKHDRKLEATSEFIFETDAYETLSSVTQIDDTKFALSARFTNEEGGMSYSFINIINEAGEILNSKIISTVATRERNYLRDSKIVHKNGVLYVTEELVQETFSLLALDMNLNELWRKEFNSFGQGSIYVDDYVYFGSVEFIESNAPPKVTLHYLEIADGSTAKSVSYDDFVQRTSIDKIIPNGQSLYLLGGTKPSSPFFGGYVLEINKSDGEMINELYIDDLYRTYDLVFSGGDFVVVGSSSSNLVALKVDNEGNVLWRTLLSSGPFSNAVYGVLDNQNGTATFAGGVNVTNADRSTDAVYGNIDLATGRLK